MTGAVRQRARKQPAEVRREEILDAAIKVFAVQSYHAAGTADIARAAGIAEPTIYRHFGSKRELYIAALGRCKQFIVEGFQDIADREPDPRRALHAMGDWYSQAMALHPEALRMRMRALAEVSDPDVQKMMRVAYDTVRVIVAGVMRKGQEAGVFTRVTSADGLAWLFIAVGSAMDSAMLMGLNPADCLRLFGEMNLASLRALLADADSAPAVYAAYVREFESPPAP